MPTSFQPLPHLRPPGRAQQLAQLTGLRVRTMCERSSSLTDTAGTDPPQLVIIPPGAGAADLARPLLDAGLAVLLDSDTHKPWRGTIGVGYDGSADADAAATVAHVLAVRAAGQLAQIEFVHVDTSASATGEMDAHTLDERRTHVIEWWLAERTSRIPARVRVTRLVGDPADALARLSADLDLLIVGSRGRARLRRLFTGSVSRDLMSSCRCPLLVIPTALSVGD